MLTQLLTAAASSFFSKNPLHNIARRPGRSEMVRAADDAVEMLEPRQLMSASYAIGIGVNDGSTSFMNASTSKLKSLGVQTVRLYYNTDFNSKNWDGTLQRAVDYSNAGFDVMLEVEPSNGSIPSYSAVQSWFSWATNNSALKNAVDRWEIGNEPDHSEYWKGSLSQYVSQLLKPAYETLHAAGETVVSAGPSYNPADVQTMINAGLLNYTDYVGFHPYATGVAGVENSLAQIKSVVAGRKPLVASEWNVRGLEGNTSAWAAAISSVFADIKSTFAINYYYAAEKSGSLAGPAGIMYSNGAANAPFYNAFATFSSGGTKTTTTTPTGNTAAGGTGSITGTLWNDADGDGAKDSNESASGVRQVFLDTDGDGVLDSGEISTQSNAGGVYKFTGLAAGSYKVARVLPAGYRISNSATHDIAVAVNPGQQVTGANIGSTNVAASTSTATAKITGTLWNDTDGDGVYDSNEAVTGARTVFIDANGNGKLDGGELSTTSSALGVYTFQGLFAGTYKIARVFPSGYAMSNAAGGELAVTLAAGQTLTGRNIGTKMIA